MVFACQTLTTTLPFSTIPTTIHLVLRVPECKDLLGRLNTIISTHMPTYNDLLSVKVYNWAAEVFNEAKKEHTEAEVDSIAKKKIQDLYHKILVDPLRPGNPLQDPVLERDCIWERSTHDQWVRMERFSYDGGPLLENPPSHLLAKALIDLRRELLVEPGYELSDTAGSASSSCSTLALPTSKPFLTIEQYEAAKASPFGMKFLMFTCQQLELDAFAMRLNDQHQAVILEMSARYNKSLQKIEEMTRDILANAHEKSAAHDEAVLRSWASVEKTHQLTTSVLRDRLANLEETHSAKRHSLTMRLEEESSQYTATARVLQGQIQAMDAAHRSTEATFKENIRLIDQAHAGKVALIQAQLSSEAAEKRRLSGNIATMEVEVAAAKEKVVEQDRVIARQKTEMFYLRIEADDAKGGDSCSVM